VAVAVSARARLAFLYTALVSAAGLVLTALTYLLVRRSMRHRIAIDIRIDGVAGGNASPPVPPTPSELADRVRATTLSELLTQAGIALAVVAVLAAVLGWVVAGRVLRPIRAISATARRLSAENLSARMPVTTPADELADLAATINGMLDRIETGIAERDRVLAGQRMFTANAAHELRTPLTTMRTAIDVTLDGEPGTAELVAMAEDVRTAAEHCGRTLDGLLALAHGQSRPGTREHRRVDLADVATALLDAAADTIAAGGLVSSGDLRTAPLDGDPILIERMVGNLLSNAVRYNRPGGRLDVVTGAAAGRVFVRVANSGVRVAPEEAERLPEPFVRGEGMRTTHAGAGAGLGLSIVRAVATAHGGEVRLRARSEGGLEVTVHLPGVAPACPAETDGGKALLRGDGRVVRG